MPDPKEGRGGRPSHLKSPSTLSIGGKGGHYVRSLRTTPQGYIKKNRLGTKAKALGGGIKKKLKPKEDGGEGIELSVETHSHC